MMRTIRLLTSLFSSLPINQSNFFILDRLRNFAHSTNLSLAIFFKVSLNALFMEPITFFRCSLLGIVSSSDETWWSNCQSHRIVSLEPTWVSPTWTTQHLVVQSHSSRFPRGSRKNQ